MGGDLIPRALEMATQICEVCGYDFGQAAPRTAFPNKVEYLPDER